MSKDSLWFGYLDAGSKSTPVVLDNSLNTANPKTLYVYNAARREILEYNREIVQPKLRDLKPGEARPEELKAGFTEALRGFRPRGARVVNLPEKGRPTATKKTEESGYEDTVKQHVGTAEEDEWSGDEE